MAVDKMTNNTIGSRMESQDKEAYSLLQKMINRPAMFVGSNRFDYIDFLFNGYCIGCKSEVSFLPSKEIQYWLLHTQSASLHGSINGATLFYRCFGSRQTAFEKYKVFLETAMQKNLNGVDDELYAYEEKYNIVRYEWEDDVPIDHYKKLAQSVYINIQEMLEQTDLVYDEVKVFIRKERLFNQVRFLLHGDYGWIDDSQIIAKPEYHKYLIAIHANARNAKVEDLRNCGYDVFDKINYDNNTIPAHDTFADWMSFSSEFASWKGKQQI